MSAPWFVVAAGAFFACTVVGTALDVVPARPAVYRAGYRVLESDFHAHTRFSDGLLSPFDVVIQARRRALDVLAITEHNNTFPGELGRAFSRAIGGPTVIVGEEITTNRFHLIAVGLHERVHAGDPLRDNIAAIHGQGGVAIAAHPVKGYWARFDTVLDVLDGAEVMHPIAFGGGGRDGWRWDDMRRFYEDARAAGHQLTAIGSSDYHFGSGLGVVRTLVFAERDDEAAVVDALRAHRTVVYDLTGKAYGDAAMIAALAKEPMPKRDADYGYHGAGLLDRAARLVGWLAALGLAVLARPKRSVVG
ncbi:MAG TPA: CehA/McbA family metallohydrolase [Byssovorax sp.]